jgi:glycosyltransferase involved in cell wall biosynthesis
MRIAYLVNQYPKISHTFIRREILALEDSGVEIVRFAVRGHETEALDPSDATELAKTRFILKAAPVAIAGACARALAAGPSLFFGALATTVRLGLRSDGGVLKHLAYFVEACVLRSWLHGSGVTHLHAHFGTNTAAIALLCQRLGGPTYSFTVHGPDEFDRPQRLALGDKVHEAQFVAAISSFGRSQLYRWSSFSDWSKVEVVHCALDPGYFVAEGAPITERPKLVCVGRLSEEKGQMLVVRAARLLTERGVEIDVVLAGDGPLRAELEKEIRLAGLQNVVHVTGWVDNQRVRSLLLESRALLLASFAEGLPVVIMEAFALARPVISTYIAGIPELVENEVNGWLIPAGDVERLADAMEKAVTTAPARLLEMGEAGRRRTFERHNTKVESAKLKRLFAATRPAEAPGAVNPLGNLREDRSAT